MPSICTRPPDAHERERLVDRRSARPTSRARRRRRVRSSPLAPPRSASLRVHGVVRAHRASPARAAVGFTSLAMIARRAGRLADAHGEDADRTAARDEHRRAGDLRAVSAVWKALPIGSWMPPISNETSSSRCHTFVAGIAMYSAKQPSRSTPMIFVLRADVRVARCGRGGSARRRCGPRPSRGRPRFTSVTRRADLARRRRRTRVRR